MQAKEPAMAESCQARFKYLLNHKIKLYDSG